jgi:addiction module RelE/StbE family toxin
MTRLRWTKPAQTDLREIRAYIARDSRKNADRFIARIKTTVSRLRRFPASGAMVAEFETPELREVFVGDYRVIYRILPGVVEVLTVLHGAHRLPDLAD